MVYHKHFSAFAAYLADATLVLQKQFESRTLIYNALYTYQTFVRFCKGQEPLSPRSAAASKAKTTAITKSAALRTANEGGCGAADGDRGRPPRPSNSGVSGGLRQRTLNDEFGITETGASKVGAGVGGRQEGMGGTGEGVGGGETEKRAGPASEGGRRLARVEAAQIPRRGQLLSTARKEVVVVQDSCDVIGPDGEGGCSRPAGYRTV